VYPIFVVLLDGLADRAHDSLGGRTANEIAETPNLDRLAVQGSCGLMFSLGPGRAPASELAHWAMLGYTPEEFPGRAVLEATGAEQEIDPGHVFAFAALRPAERRDDGLWLTGRPRRGEDEEDSAELVTACDGLEFDGLRFELEHLQRGEAILRVFPGADDRVTDSDAFYKEWYPVLKPQPQVPEAGHTPLNVITLKWWGRRRSNPSFRERHGLHGSFLGDSAFLLGLARTIGLEPRHVAETGDAPADLRARMELAHRRLDEGDTFVFSHLKATDMAGHTKDPQIKKSTIEALDAELGDLPTDRAIVCVTGDHATPTYPDVIHSGDPVPFMVNGPGVRADEVEAFGELDCARGILGHLSGPDMMPVLLNAADRPLFLGSRPTPFPGADGYPDLLTPL
jgi:2,3-bisphosphoglycerate-independent phosphoglycerate mutase